MTYNSKKNTPKNEADNVVLNGVLTIVNDGSWVGTMTELNSAIKKVLSRKEAKSLPASPAALRVVLNRIINRIRTRKVSVKFNRTNKTRYVKLTH